MSLIFIGDVLSYELAMLNKVDPEGVESIRKLKEQLKKKVNLTKELEKEIIKLDL
jgi:hypothetical protein